MRRGKQPSLLLGSFAALILGLPGCGTVSTTNTPRTGTEQRLLSIAWDSALHKVDFRPLTGVPIYLDTSNLSALDQGYVVSSIKEALLEQGALLRAKPEQAQWIVEARVGAYGTDEDKWLFGIAQTTIPPTVTGVPSGTIPEISLAKRNRQQGVAKLALFAYDRAGGQLVWRSGTMQAFANAKDVYVGGVGPLHTDPDQDGAEIMGAKIPDPTNLGKPTLPKPKPRFQAAPFEPPPMAPPASAADWDAFAPTP